MVNYPPCPTGIEWIEIADRTGIATLISPPRLGLDYGRRPSVVIAEHGTYFTWVPLAVFAVLLWRFRRRAPVLVAVALVFMAALTPVMGVDPL